MPTPSTPLPSLPLSFEKLWELISLQTAEAPKRTRSNLSALFFPSRTPPSKKKKKKKGLLTKGCLSCQEFSTFLALADIFLFYKGPFGKFPLIAGFSPALIGGIHSTVWLGRVLGLESEKGRVSGGVGKGALGPGILSDSAEPVEAFQGRSQSQCCGPVPWRWLSCFPHFHLQCNRTCGLYSWEWRGCSYWVARLWGPPLVRESLDKFASSNQAECFFMFPVFVEFLSAALRRLCSSKGFFSPQTQNIC